MASQRQLIEVDPQRIQFNPLNPRKHRGTEFLRLRASIQTIGIVQLPTVRVIPGNFFEVIDGEGRVLIAQEEHFEKIWVISVGLVEDAEAFMMLQSANAARSYNYIAESCGLAELHRRGSTLDQLSRQFASNSATMGDMVAVGNFPNDLITSIQEDIARSEEQAERYKPSMFKFILPLRVISPGSMSDGRSTPSHPLYEYTEIAKAVELIKKGEITTTIQMSTYVANRRYEMYQERFDADLHQKLEEALTKARQELYLLKEQEVKATHKELEQRYEGQIRVLQNQVDDLARRHTEVIREVAKRPEIIARREAELWQKVQEVELKREELEKVRRQQEKETEQAQERLQEQERQRQRLFQEERQKMLATDLALQQAQQQKVLEYTEANLKKHYEQKDSERQFKAENTIQGLLTNGIKLMADAQQILEHIVSAGMLPGVLQLGGKQKESIVSQIQSLRETLDKAEEKLTHEMLVVQEEGGMDHGYNRQLQRW